MALTSASHAACSPFRPPLDWTWPSVPHARPLAVAVPVPPRPAWPLCAWAAGAALGLPGPGFFRTTAGGGGGG